MVVYAGRHRPRVKQKEPEMKDWIPLLQSLVWPLFVLGLVVWFRAGLKTVLAAIAERIRSGAPFEAGPSGIKIGAVDRKSTRLNSSHIQKSRMPSSA